MRTRTGLRPGDAWVLAGALLLDGLRLPELAQQLQKLAAARVGKR